MCQCEPVYGPVDPNYRWSQYIPQHPVIVQPVVFSPEQLAQLKVLFIEVADMFNTCTLPSKKEK